MLKVTHLGKNVIMTMSMDGPVYSYQYTKTIDNDGSSSTFSNNLEELKLLNFMEENGLGPEDMINDIRYPTEI